MPERELGRVTGTTPGRRLVIVAGVHGNEAAGVAALERLLAILRGRQEELRGEVVGLVGNRRALEAGTRYVARDLNRLWTPDELARLAARDPSADDADGAEQRALKAALDRELAPGTLMLDLHTTSAPGPPFACIADDLTSRRLALAVGATVVLGLEETVEGTLLDYLEMCGRPGVVLEGGDNAAAADVLVTLALRAATRLGMLPRNGTRRAHRSGPAVVEVVHRHVAGPDFVMEPGWRHFEPVAAGAVLAREGDKPVYASVPGLLLMPRYQTQGDDGFFIVRPVARVWLALSRVIRHLGGSALLVRLPGVHRDPGQRDEWVVNTNVARWGTVGLFHLAGFRLVARGEGMLRFRRRTDGR